MKRFLKFLTLVLALAAITTAFTVVALADGDDTAVAPVVKYNFSYDTETIGSPRESNAGGAGKFVISAEEGSANHYVLYHQESASGSSYLSGMYGGADPCAKTPISKYQYEVLEFDFMRMTKTIPSFTIGTYIKPGNVGYPTVYSSTIANKTTSEIYTWQRVAVIFSYHAETVDGVKTGYTSYTVLVNGVKVAETLKAKSFKYDENGLLNGKKEDQLYFTDIRINGAGGTNSYKVAFDNVKVTMRQREGSHDETIAKIAAESYYDGYTFPYTKTRALIGAVGYDDLNKAIEAADSEDVVSLREDVTDAIVINKNVVIDTNIYSTDAETGETTIVGSYEFSFASTLGYTAEVENGIYTIKKASNLAEVKWDPACDGECNCYAEFGGHRLTLTTMVALGDIPEFAGNIPTFEITSTGASKRFVGWSYENDGTADELHPVTAEEVANGSFILYPVYEEFQYDYEVIAGGVSTFYLEEENDLGVIASNCASGAKIILRNDVTMYHTILVTTNNKALTLDLNGFDLTRHYVKITEYNALYNEDSGDYDLGTKIESKYEGYDTEHIVTYSSGDKSFANCIFGINAKYVTLTLTSSKSGANIYAMHTSADRLMLNGEEIRTENVKIEDGVALFFLTPALGAKITIDGENLSYYGGTIFSAEHGSNDKTGLYVVNGGKYHAVGGLSESFFAVRNGETVNVNDAEFYLNEHYLIRNIGSNRDKSTKMFFNDCDLYGAHIYSVWENDIYRFENCRFVSTTYVSQQSAILCDGTVTTGTSKNLSVDKGRVFLKTEGDSYSFKYMNAAVEYDALSGKFIPVFTEGNAIEGNFTYAIKKASDVEERLEDVMFSMTYYSGFELVLYVPADANPSMVFHFALQSGTVKVDGNEYRVFKKSCTTLGAADIENATITYTVGDVEYKQGFDLSALVYAELVLPYSDNDIEKTAVASMLRYIAEAYATTANTAPEKLSELQAIYPLADYKDKAEYANLGVDGSGLDGVALSIMLSASNAGYRITLPNATFGAASDAVVTMSFRNGEALELKRGSADSKTYYWYAKTPVRIYDLIENVVDITITLSNGETLCGSYSVGAYIQGTDNTLAKAAYEFGVAARAYRTYLEQL